MYDLSDRSVLINDPNPAVCHQLVVMNYVHVPVVIVLTKDVKAAFVTDKPTWTLDFVGTITVVLLSVEVTF